MILCKKTNSKNMLTDKVAFTEPHLTSIMKEKVNPAYPGHVSYVPWNMYYFSKNFRSYLLQIKEKEL